MTTPTQDPPDWLVIRRWLPSLTQTRRRVLHLRYWEHLPVPVVAAYLDTTEEYAPALERLALADLRQHLPQ